MNPEAFQLSSERGRLVGARRMLEVDSMALR